MYTEKAENGKHTERTLSRVEELGKVREAARTTHSICMRASP
jgi:hypothetical protein